jgi:glycosyltransferase involved in cell wall biosynthesis
MANISLYIPCYNGAATIARCVESALNSSDRPADIMVIDDGSTDETAAIVGRYPVRLIQHPHNLGLGVARNRGLKEARYDWVASIDADVTMQADWPTVMLQTREAFPSAAGFGGRLIETRTDGFANRWRSRHMLQDWGEKRIIKPPFLFGANTLMNRTKILGIGGYDERMRTNGEDVNLAYRLYQGQETLIYEPRALCSHLRSDNLQSVLRTHWAWHRHPYSVLFPPQSARELRLFMTKRNFRPALNKMKKDFCEGQFLFAAFDFYCALDNGWREWMSYRKKERLSSATPRV